MRVYCVLEVINNKDGGNHVRLEAIYEKYEDAQERVAKLNTWNPGSVFFSQAWEVK